jgi:beta-lactamase regulating signal transducer with metallopeptidase domain
MTDILSFDSVTYVIGWSLLHLVWEGAIIAALLVLLLTVLRSATPGSRYLLCCVALVAMCCAGVANLLLVKPPKGMLREVTQYSRDANFRIPAPDSVLVETATAQSPQSGEDLSAVSSLKVSDPRFPTFVSANGSATIFHTVGKYLNRHIAMLVIAWACGVMLLAVRLLGGWIALRKLYRGAALLGGAELEEAFIRLAGAMDVRDRVRIFLSPTGVTPVTFGILKPVVLFPASLVSGLPMAELEALLAHELAHIRRHDYVVNLLQSLAETLLYYHPAVW